MRIRKKENNNKKRTKSKNERRKKEKKAEKANQKVKNNLNKVFTYKNILNMYQSGQYCGAVYI